jgi:peptidoglycan L-alanyl-D-glutamate endopeptidase CwlK
MPYFSQISSQKLGTCHIVLQEIAYEAIKIYDFSVLCGHRSEVDQMIAYQEGRSHVVWPDSKHNKLPSMAMDLAPWPIDWNDINRFYELAGVIQTIAFQKDVKIVWGGKWKSLKDYPHFEYLEV